MAQKWSILGKKWPNMAGMSTFQSENPQPKVTFAKKNTATIFEILLPKWISMDSTHWWPQGQNLWDCKTKKAIKYAKCKMQNAKLVLRVQRWLAPTCPWVTGGRRGLCLASREEAAASPGLQALETHNRESHLMKSVFFNSTLSFGRESLMLLTNGNIHPGEEARRRI